MNRIPICKKNLVLGELIKFLSEKIPNNKIKKKYNFKKNKFSKKIIITKKIKIPPIKTGVLEFLTKFLWDDFFLSSLRCVNLLKK